jgi:hypothetical protein
MHNDIYLIFIDFLLYQTTSKIIFQGQIKDIRNGAGHASDMRRGEKTAS